MVADYKRPARFAGGAALVSLLLACSPGELDSDPLESEAGGQRDVPHFAVRGRLMDGPRLNIRVDETGGPLAPGSFLSAVREAMAIWNATDMVHLQESPAADGPEVLLAWRRGSHEDCQSFGHDSSVAHAGPVSATSLIHFDSDSDWSLAGEGELDLTQVILHELGHVLGLDHSLDEGAVMHASYEKSQGILGTSDLAGMASLYGGLEDRRGDLYLDSTGEPLLRRIAPAGVAGFALWDVDRNGRQDLLVWREDVAGDGQLMLYHFDEEQRLEASSGPMIGCVVPKSRVVLDVNTEGVGVLLSILPDGQYYARQFEKGLVPIALAPGAPLALKGGFTDLDGDRVLDVIPEAAEKEPESVRGDLDGDGSLEVVRRR